MAITKKAICRQCGKRKYLSVRGLCMSCGMANRSLAANQIQARQGPIYNSWQAGMLKHAVGIAGKLKLSDNMKKNLINREQQLRQQQEERAPRKQEIKQVPRPEHLPHHNSPALSRENLPPIPHYPEQE